jgi:hypothetical protein
MFDQRLKAKTKRKQDGATLALILSCAAVLIMCLLAIFSLIQIFTGSDRTRNAVENGTLNIAKHVMDIKVDPNDTYSDCVDTNGKIGLSNMNRVWGKALLINANDEAMIQDQLSSGNDISNAELAYQDAQFINDGLYKHVTDANHLQTYFDQLMLGKNNKHSLDNLPQTAMVYRGDESNLQVSKQQIATLSKQTPSGGSTTFEEMSTAGRMKGYHPIRVNNKQFAFLTFHNNEMPHLIDGKYFIQNTNAANPITGIKHALPNAYMGTGSINNITSSASAVANPQQNYAASIPHAFLVISFQNTADWYVNNNKVTETTYNTNPKEYWGVQDYKLPCNGLLDGYATLGKEYVKIDSETKVTNPISLWTELTRLPQDQFKLAMTSLMQRVQEINPSYTFDQMQKMLDKQNFTDDNQYVIYPTYKSSDYTDPQIQCAPFSTGSFPSWLQKNNPSDGSTKPGEKGTYKGKSSSRQIVMDPSGNQSKNKKKCKMKPPTADISSKTEWQPATGYQQNLGQLNIKHLTEVRFRSDDQ